MAPKKRVKRVFEYRGPEADEIVTKSTAPKKAERKKIARVGKQERDQAPAASRDGFTISERRLAEAMGGGKGKKREAQEKRPEPAAVKRLKQLQGAAGAMESHAYKRALGAALKQGLKEQRAEAVVVAKHAGKQTEKNRAYREKKREKKKGKKSSAAEERELDEQLHGRKEVIRFGEVAQAPPPMDKWVAKLESIKVKLRSKKEAEERAAQQDRQ